MIILGRGCRAGSRYSGSSGQLKRQPAAVLPVVVGELVVKLLGLVQVSRGGLVSRLPRLAILLGGMLVQDLTGLSGTAGRGDLFGVSDLDLIRMGGDRRDGLGGAEGDLLPLHVLRGADPTWSLDVVAVSDAVVALVLQVPPESLHDLRQLRVPLQQPFGPVARTLYGGFSVPVAVRALGVGVVPALAVVQLLVVPGGVMLAGPAGDREVEVVFGLEVGGVREVQPRVHERRAGARDVVRVTRLLAGIDAPSEVVPDRVERGEMDAEVLVRLQPALPCACTRLFI